MRQSLGLEGGLNGSRRGAPHVRINGHIESIRTVALALSSLNIGDGLNGNGYQHGPLFTFRADFEICSQEEGQAVIRHNKCTEGMAARAQGCVGRICSCHGHVRSMRSEYPYNVRQKAALMPHLHD